MRRTPGADNAVNDSLVGATFSFPDQNGVNHTYQVLQPPTVSSMRRSATTSTRISAIFVSVQNVTDSAQHTYLQWPNLPFTYDDAGRRYFLGFKVKL